MNHAIHYLMSGDGHAHYLVVSLNSLRRHYTGRVVIHAYPESIATMTRVASDTRLGVETVLWEPLYCTPGKEPFIQKTFQNRGKNSQFINKICMMQKNDSGVGLYLDADTFIVGKFDKYFEYAEQYGFVATQFNDWVTNVGRIRGRVSMLLGRESINQDAVKRVIHNTYPSVNGGVFFCKPNSEVLRTWREWSLAVRDIFICDEIALHAIMGFYWQKDMEFRVIRDGVVNCSPKFRPAFLKDEDLVVWHGHGDSFTRPNKSKRGVELWTPEFQYCLNNNVGGMQEWIGTVNNKFLSEFLKGTHG